MEKVYECESKRNNKALVASKYVSVIVICRHQLSINVSVPHDAVQCHEASGISGDIGKLLLQMKPVQLIAWKMFNTRH